MKDLSNTYFSKMKLKYIMIKSKKKLFNYCGIFKVGPGEKCKYFREQTKKNTNRYFCVIAEMEYQGRQGLKQNSKNMVSINL